VLRIYLYIYIWNIWNIWNIWDIWNICVGWTHSFTRSAVFDDLMIGGFWCWTVGCASKCHRHAESFSSAMLEMKHSNWKERKKVNGERGKFDGWLWHPRLPSLCLSVCLSLSLSLVVYVKSKRNVSWVLLVVGKWVDFECAWSLLGGAGVLASPFQAMHGLASPLTAAYGSAPVGGRHRLPFLIRLFESLDWFWFPFQSPPLLLPPSLFLSVFLSFFLSFFLSVCLSVCPLASLPHTRLHSGHVVALHDIYRPLAALPVPISGDAHPRLRFQ